jgi:hypothetical protein
MYIRRCLDQVLYMLMKLFSFSCSIGVLTIHVKVRFTIYTWCCNRCFISMNKDIGLKTFKNCNKQDVKSLPLCHFVSLSLFPFTLVKTTPCGAITPPLISLTFTWWKPSELPVFQMHSLEYSYQNGKIISVWIASGFCSAVVVILWICRIKHVTFILVQSYTLLLQNRGLPNQ